ncbi:hypothetical protein [Actinomadura sp. HBU206391]|uniref:hypothetical protein n=1 Tax=Actinomadura sp. HBU206391 TaxID=2731692 RepID=UPI00164EE7C0|nr:hypothetical protein [Actinomadura sp. HBU206391]MBC6457455.1 hypothetical protein [Actinomadura sp. HBU206391]
MIGQATSPVIVPTPHAAAEIIVLWLKQTISGAFRVGRIWGNLPMHTPETPIKRGRAHLPERGSAAELGRRIAETVTTVQAFLAIFWLTPMTSGSRRHTQCADRSAMTVVFGRATIYDRAGRSRPTGTVDPQSDLQPSARGH